MEVFRRKPHSADNEPEPVEPREEQLNLPNHNLLKLAAWNHGIDHRTDHNDCSEHSDFDVEDRTKYNHHECGSL